jgi:hypothetical protein
LGQRITRHIGDAMPSGNIGDALPFGTTHPTSGILSNGKAFEVADRTFLTNFPD